MKGVLWVLAAAAGAAAACTNAAVGGGDAWHRVAQARAAGVVSLRATAPQPSAFAVELAADAPVRVAAVVVVACGSGFGRATATTRVVGRAPYTKILRMPPTVTDRCDVRARGASAPVAPLRLTLLSR